jgi:hypothetical protein
MGSAMLPRRCGLGFVSISFIHASVSSPGGREAQAPPARQVRRRGSNIRQWPLLHPTVAPGMHVLSGVWTRVPNPYDMAAFVTPPFSMLRPPAYCSSLGVSALGKVLYLRYSRRSRGLIGALSPRPPVSQIYNTRRDYERLRDAVLEVARQGKV